MRKEANLVVVSDADRRILEGMEIGDRAALEQLYASCFPVVSRMVLQNSGTDDEAKDVFQEAVLVLYDKVVHPSGFELNCRLSTYMYAVSRRLWLRGLREKGRFAYDLDPQLGQEPDLQQDDLQQDLEVHRERESQFEQMEQCLQALGEPCRTILLEVYMHGKSMQEISEQLGYTNADNAKNQKYKCLQRLKRLYFTASATLHRK